MPLAGVGPPGLPHHSLLAKGPGHPVGGSPALLVARDIEREGQTETTTLHPGEYSDGALIAASVAASGWPVLPVRRGSKHPTHHAAPENVNHRRWWLTSPAEVVEAHETEADPWRGHAGCQFAVITGNTLDGETVLVGFDVDGGWADLDALLAEAGPEAFEWAAETVRVQRCDERAHLLGTLQCGTKVPRTAHVTDSLEWRGTGGYLLLPGAQHPEGGRYEVTRGRYEFTDGQQPEGSVFVGLTDDGCAAWVHPLPLPAALVAAVAARVDGIDIAKAHARAKTDGDAAGAGVSEGIAPGADEAEVFERVAELVETLARAPSGSGNTEAARIACMVGNYVAAGQIEHGRALELLLSAFEGWSWHRPADRRTMEHTVRSQLDYGARSPRPWIPRPESVELVHAADPHLSDEPQCCPDAERYGHRHAACRICRAREDWVREDAARSRAARSWSPPPEFGTLADELAEELPATPWLIEGLLPEGANLLVSAAAKAGKTTLALNLAHSLVDGVDLFDHYRVTRRSRVGWWNLELTRQSAIGWLRDLKVAQPADLSVLHLRGHPMPLMDRTAQEWAVGWLRAQEVDTWIVDPLGALYDGDENDNSAVRDYLKALDEIRLRAGVGQLVVVTHTGHQARVTDDVRTRGASVFLGWPDVLVQFRKGSKENGTADKRYLSAFGRDVDLAEAGLDYEPDTRSLVWSGGSRREDAGEAQARMAYDVVNRLVHELGREPNTGEVVAAMGGKAERARGALDLAVKEGWLVRTELNSRHKTYRTGVHPRLDVVTIPPSAEEGSVP